MQQIATAKVIPIRSDLPTQVAPGHFRIFIEMNRCPRCRLLFNAKSGHDCPPPSRPFAMAMAA
jgi:hypothetical protein